MEPLPFEFEQDVPVSATLVSSDGSTIFGHHDYFDALSWTNASRTVRLRVGESMVWLDSGTPAGSNSNGDILARNINQMSLRPGTIPTSYQRAYVDDGSGSDPFQAIVNSPDAAGWTLTRISGMSDDGKVVIGSGVHGDHLEGWVAHLP